MASRRHRNIFVAASSVLPAVVAVAGRFGVLQLGKPDSHSETPIVSHEEKGVPFPRDATKRCPNSLTNIGRLVFVIAPDSTGTLSLRGQQTDLCATVG